MMTPSLEVKLAQLVGYLERQHFGTGANTVHIVDTAGIKHLLNDREVSAWLDCMRLQGVGPGPILNTCCPGHVRNK